MNLEDLFRRNELLAFVLNGNLESKADYAQRFNVAEVTINRDLLWLRKKGIQIYSKNNKVVLLGNPSKSTILELCSNYLPLKLQSELVNKSLKGLSIIAQTTAFAHLVLISKAIKERLMLKMKYKRFYDNEIDDYEIKPLSLFQRGNNWSMQAIKKDEGVIKTFYVSRIQKLWLSDKRFSQIKDAISENKKEKIVLKFSSEVADQLIDKVWFEDFELKTLDNGDVLLITEREITNNLAAWCISWWDKIEIIKPRKLRDYIREMVTKFMNHALRG